MAGNFSFIKTVNKAQWWHVHGTHSLDPGQLARIQREKLSRPRPEMFETIQEALASMRRKRPMQP